MDYMTTYTSAVVRVLVGEPSKHVGNIDRQRLRERERENAVQISKEDGGRPCKVERTAKIHLQGAKTWGNSFSKSFFFLPYFCFYINPYTALPPR